MVQEGLRLFCAVIHPLPCPVPEGGATYNDSHVPAGVSDNPPPHPQPKKIPDRQSISTLSASYTFSHTVMSDAYHPVCSCICRRLTRSGRAQPLNVPCIVIANDLPCRQTGIIMLRGPITPSTSPPTKIVQWGSSSRYPAFGVWSLRPTVVCAAS